MDILERICAAGVVGAGGAGFPTHIKLDCSAEYVIANGAECEPLLRVDQQLMEISAEKIVEGLEAAMQQVGAKEGVIFLKAHYHRAIDALQKHIHSKKDIRLYTSKSYYPAGDEQQIIYEVTRRIVPPGGLPKDVGCIVSNVSTLADIARAMKNIPVTERYITVAGAVKTPRTLLAPLGAPMESLIELVDGVTAQDCSYIIGGPCMGTLTNTLNGNVITKTTGGLLVLPKGHPLLRVKNADIRFRTMLSVCCQCSMCTQMCPRNALGLGTSPHKAMRSIASGTNLIGDANSILTCCDCGVCTYHACTFGLNPAMVMKRMKQEMLANGIKLNRASLRETDFYIDNKRLSSNRLIARLGLKQYDLPAPIDPQLQQVSQVRIPLRMLIGAPAVPVVKKGNPARRGMLIAQPATGALGANIHASIGGTVTDVTAEYIEIRV